jgi:hypothetical protein
MGVSNQITCFNARMDGIAFVILQRQGKLTKTPIRGSNDRNSDINDSINLDILFLPLLLCLIRVLLRSVSNG